MAIGSQLENLIENRLYYCPKTESYLESRLRQSKVLGDFQITQVYRVKCGDNSHSPRGNTVRVKSKKIELAFTQVVVTTKAAGTF